MISIPEGMAYAMVAGVNPIYGLYTGMVTIVVAALTGSTNLMIVTLTNALALVTGDALAVPSRAQVSMPRVELKHAGLEFMPGCCWRWFWSFLATYRNIFPCPAWRRC